MSRPTYYLWLGDFSGEEEYLRAREALTRLGFRPAAFRDGTAKEDLRAGLRALTAGHWRDQEPGPKPPVLGGCL